MSDSKDRLVGNPLQPNWIVQPFNLRFEPDDLHVMAYFSDHPEYEAVEAMIRIRAERLPLVRAILTRHDQSQVDHSNDDQSVSSLFEERERCFRDIACVIEDSIASRRVLVCFESFRHETVELDITSLGLPVAERGGLSDPGNHSLRSALPIMYRGRSALAAPQSRVTIDGRSLHIPPRIEAAGRVIALAGFFTEMHSMAALRSGVVRLELVDMPATFQEGECWVYRSAGELATYRISRVLGTGAIEVTRADTKAEWIRGTIINGKIELIEVRVQHPGDTRHFVSLGFSDDTFTIDIDGTKGLVTGTVEGSAVGEDQKSVKLIPTSPAWAANRPVSVEMARTDVEISLETTIG
jgi:hypothetical protein